MTIKSTGTRIRPVLQTEAAVVTDIIRHAFQDVADRFKLTEQNCPKHPSNCRQEWIQEALQKGVLFYILEVDGKQCGCVALEKANPDVCYLERLAVLPEYRRCGYGRALVLHALEEARVLGVQKVDIGIIAEDAELKEWYGRQGFEVTRRAAFEHLPFEVMFMSLAV